jgi:hypothetical protein
MAISDSARWAGIPPNCRGWILSAFCGGERFLALVRSGVPADLAWTRACELMADQAPGLVAEWGSSIWSTPSLASDRGRSPLTPLREAGASLKKAVQVSLMEGRPCTERVEGVMYALRQELRARVDRELTLIGTRALKPLFLCVAPALFGLLTLGFWLAWQESMR